MQELSNALGLLFFFKYNFLLGLFRKKNFRTVISALMSVMLLIFPR